MKNLQDDIKEEFTFVQSLHGYERPKNLSEMEREPMNDDVYDISNSRISVDVFLKKNRGWR